MFSIITIIVAFILAVSYAYQLLLPVATGTKEVTVNLTDPTLIASELILLLLTGAWIYIGIGISSHLFSTRLGRAIQKARVFEAEIDRRMNEGLS